jgi:putative hydrolase of the HAD superfamily
MIKAITFDLWDTVFIDDSDEPKRKAAGRPSKKVERRDIVFEYANRYKKIDREFIDIVYDTVDEAFRKVWHDQHVTWTVEERLTVLFKGLKIELADNEMKEVVRLHEEMELEFRPDFVPGVHEAIKELHGKYKLGVISDAIFSPGRVLKQILEGEDLLHYFDSFVFSDEIGCAKPQSPVFEKSFENLSVKAEEVVHIGDREHNDILGPKKNGMKAILCTASLDRGSEDTQADAVFSDYSKLPEIIESINNS